MNSLIKTYAREASVGATIIFLMAVLLFTEPAYFSRENLVDIFLANVPVLVIALGMTLIIITGQIDISVGSIFAICSVITGITARSGYPGVIGVLAACVMGALFGAINGSLVGYMKIPSIVVTLATMVALRDALRWSTQGSWIGNLPAKFQWLGLTQSQFTAFTFVSVITLTLCFGWGLHSLVIARKVFATGSNESAARIVGINTRRVVFAVFTLTGVLSGLAAALNALRFRQIPSNSGLGLEMKVIAAVAVGGAAITGGAATITGTVLGVVLLGSIGTALTFLGVSAYWEKAIQGAIILGAITINTIANKREKNAPRIEALAS